MQLDSEPTNLINKLSSEQQAIVIDAIKKLADSKYSTQELVRQKLLSLLQETNNHFIRNEVAIALGDIKEKRAVSIIVELLKNPKTINHRGTLVYALSAFNCADLLPFLIDLVILGGFEVSREAFQIIENIETEIDEDIWFQCKKKLQENLPLVSEEKSILLQELYELFAQDDLDDSVA